MIHLFLLLLLWRIDFSVSPPQSKEVNIILANYVEEETSKSINLPEKIPPAEAKQFFSGETGKPIKSQGSKASSQKSVKENNNFKQVEESLEKASETTSPYENLVKKALAGKGDEYVYSPYQYSSQFGGQKVSNGVERRGIYHTLKNRKILDIPILKPKNLASGVVAIKVKVDEKGNVIYATLDIDNSNTTNSELVECALSMAKKAKFNSLENQEIQIGIIFFEFKTE